MSARHDYESAAIAADKRVGGVCVALNAPSKVAECAASEVRAAEANRRDALDLAAQEGMADAAFLMLWVTALSVAVTSLGAYFVWRTLILTKDTLKEAGEATKAAEASVEVTRLIGEAQTRAYITVSSAQVIATGGGLCMVQIKIKNSGTTPAKSIQASWRVVPFSIEGQKIIEKGASSFYDLPFGGEHYLEEHVSVSRGIFEGDAWHNTEEQMIITGCVEYQDVFNQWRSTGFAFQTSAKDFHGNANLKASKEGNYST